MRCAWASTTLSSLEGARNAAHRRGRGYVTSVARRNAAPQDVFPAGSAGRERVRDDSFADEGVVRVVRVRPCPSRPLLFLL